MFSLFCFSVSKYLISIDLQNINEEQFLSTGKILTIVKLVVVKRLRKGIFRRKLWAALSNILLAIVQGRLINYFVNQSAMCDGYV